MYFVVNTGTVRVRAYVRHNILWYLSGFPAGNDRRKIYAVSPGHGTHVFPSEYHHLFRTRDEHVR